MLGEIFSRTNLTVFPLTSVPGVHLTSKIEGVPLIGRWCLKEGGAYFKVKGTIHMKFQNL